MSKTTYVYETKRDCLCGRPVDAIRIVGESSAGLRISRHLKKHGRGFCARSLDEAPRK